MDYTLSTSNGDTAYRKHLKEHNEGFVTLRSKNTSKNPNTDKLHLGPKEQSSQWDLNYNLWCLNMKSAQCVLEHTRAHESTLEWKTISEKGIKVIIKGDAWASLNIKLGKQNIERMNPELGSCVTLDQTQIGEQI